MFLFSRHFVGSLDFRGMEVDEALRVYQTCFRLPVSVLCFCQSVFFSIGSSSTATSWSAGNIP